MINTSSITNELIHETSPYLLQHAHNPVNWHPWGAMAFERARREDKPVFLSIGYSTCHWCHVMAHESFEDMEVADRLNRNFISVKVDREERPDLDGIYMRACQAITGSGGWPTSVFITAEGKPFFAGTYFPKQDFLRILEGVTRIWQRDRQSVIKSGETLAAAISEERTHNSTTEPIKDAEKKYRSFFDPEFGGFGSAPKFPSPHNLMYLLYAAPDMAEKTLMQMYRGGIFDHVGGGFSRYSTDRYWLVPHFEKMLYDNALLAFTYIMAYEKTENELYRHVTERVLKYIDRDLKCPEGGYYSAQDADTEGVEGKYYVFNKNELINLLGEERGEKFCRRYDITVRGNFEGKSIPNLLKSPEPDDETDALLGRVFEYRKHRVAPHTDKKRLTGWNALTAAAYAMTARILKDEEYLKTAERTLDFIERELTDGCSVFAGITAGKRLGPGFLDDYAYYIFALIQMHQASLKESYIHRASELANKVWDSFWDEENGGLYFSGSENERLISRLKESSDGAMPSGNSVMAYVFSRLSLLTEEKSFEEREKLQRQYMNGEASAYPMGFGFYLYSSLPVKKVICSVKDQADLKNVRILSDWAFRLSDSPDYPLINDKTTYYVCENKTCRPPTNEI